MTPTEVTAAVADPLLNRGAGTSWWIGLAVALAFAALLPVSLAVLFIQGVGVWGNNAIVVWGFDIANYIWWIGIGNAGTLISSMLLLTRQRWRASINRFAETMTLCAAAMAGIYPIIHLGRPWLFYWLLPYPNSMAAWPQWRSPLVWDFWAIAAYILFSIMFWYLGMLPDLATLRDRARRRGAQLFYGVLALGWCGSARDWQRYHALQITMAALAVPLVVSVHSVVGLDFATSLLPGWQESIFPPYFVVGAMFSGFAMAVLLAALIRHGLGLQAMITSAHFDAMAKIMLFAACFMGLAYATEWFSAWYGGGAADRALLAYLFQGDYAPLYFAMLAGNVVVPQLLWFPALRRNVPVLCVIGVLVNVGMWLERVLILWNTLSHGLLPATRQMFTPTLWDVLLFAGTLGCFALLLLMFVRLLPAVAMHEVSAQEGRA